MEALIIHNNLLMRAKWDCFGFTLEQEGGEWPNHLFISMATTRYRARLWVRDGNRTRKGGRGYCLNRVIRSSDWQPVSA